MTIKFFFASQANSRVDVLARIGPRLLGIYRQLYAATGTYWDAQFVKRMCRDVESLCGAGVRNFWSFRCRFIARLFSTSKCLHRSFAHLLNEWRNRRLQVEQ